MRCTRRVIIYQYYINARFIWDFFYENTINLAFRPPVLSLIGVINDLEIQCIADFHMADLVKAGRLEGQMNTT